MSLSKILKLSFALVISSWLFFSFFTQCQAAPLNRQEWRQAVGRSNPTYSLEDNIEHVYNDSLHAVIDSAIGHGGSEGSGEGNNGAVGDLGSLIGFMYQKPPASSVDYLADIAQKAGIAKPVYAQSIGWQALSPVLQVWKAFRNVAYLGFVIIFIVIGFMIMFRAKIDPQTVISVQAALPKLIITLLAITFSYAIAGLMIDLIYVAIYALVGIFSLGGLITNSEVAINNILEKNLFKIIYGGGIFLRTPGAVITELIEGALGETAFGQIAGFVGGNLFIGIMAIVLLFTVFKLFISLLICYVTFIFQVVFAPITLLFNAFPGSNSFGSWLKGLLANIAPFPAVALLFVLASIFMGSSQPCGSDENPWCVNRTVGYRSRVQESQQVWVPPFLTVGSEGGGGGAHPILGLIGIGMILMAPKVTSLIKKQLQVESSGIGGAVMAPIAGGIGYVGGAAQQLAAYTKAANERSLATERHKKLLQAMGSGPPRQAAG